MKIAIVVMRYGGDIVGGAEYHARMIAEHLNERYDIEVLTTCAKDYRTWKNEYPEGMEIINSVLVRRFKNFKNSNPTHQNKLREIVFYQKSHRDREIEWINELGPNNRDLILYLRESEPLFDLFIFFTYRYYTTYYGIQEVGEKALLAPLAENDPALHLTTTKETFHHTRGIIYNSPEERQLILNKVKFHETEKIWDIIGCGIDIPSGNSEPFDPKSGDYILYIGRIEGSKGCFQLFEYYLRFISERKNAPGLILAGFDAIGIPKHKKIKYLGFVSEEAKIKLLKNAKMLVMPSPYESLSLVTLESMACGTPVLVNGECDVLKGHCIRSNAGLWYQNYDEFKEGIFLLSSNIKLREIMKRNGIRYIRENYSWDVIIQKYLAVFHKMGIT